MKCKETAISCHGGILEGISFFRFHQLMEFKIMDFMTAFMFEERPQDCCEESIHFRVVDPFQDVARVSQNSRCYLAVDEAAFSPKACCALLIDSIVRYAFVLFHFRMRNIEGS